MLPHLQGCTADSGCFFKAISHSSFISAYCIVVLYSFPTALPTSIGNRYNAILETVRRTFPAKGDRFMKKHSAILLSKSSPS